MTNTRNSQEVWETETKKYSRPHLRLRQVASLVKDLKPQNMFDIGCSEGFLGKLCSPVEYYGCDFADVGQGAHFPFKQCDLSRDKVPFEGMKFDVVTCSGILEYVDNLDGLLAQIHERLKENGSFVLTYFNMRHLNRRIKKSAYRHPDWKNNFSLSELFALVEKNGFKVTCGYAMTHGFGVARGVDEMTDAPLVIPKIRFYSGLLAHQFTLQCKKFS